MNGLHFIHLGVYNNIHVINLSVFLYQLCGENKRKTNNHVVLLSSPTKQINEDDSYVTKYDCLLIVLYIKNELRGDLTGNKAQPNYHN